MLKKPFVAAAPGALLIFALMGCGAHPTPTAASEQPAAKAEATSTGTVNTDDSYEVVLSNSTIYSEQDQKDAIDTVMAEFSKWDGCTMKRIAVESDEVCTEALSYANSLKDAGAEDFDQAMVIVSDFHSPSAELAENTAWTPDTDYNDYTWTLGRTQGGAWQLLTWGYA